MGKNGAGDTKSGVRFRIEGHLGSDVGGRGGAVRWCGWGLGWD